MGTPIAQPSFGPALEAFPFSLRELDHPDEGCVALFQRSFNANPPEEPRHFVALRSVGDCQRTAGYIHFTQCEPGVYLIGGLCVDARLYRHLTPPQRRAVAQAGSLSRWLSARSIASLGPKRAVFAYTGDARSRRDAFAIDFVPATGEYLLVQWHDESSSDRENLVRAVADYGAF